MNLEGYLAKVKGYAPYLDLERIAKAYDFGEEKPILDSLEKMVQLFLIIQLAFL